MFDMNQCKKGDKLISCHGEILEYAGRTGMVMYPHKVFYKDGGYGTRTDDGFVAVNNRLPSDHNIVGFAPKTKK